MLRRGSESSGCFSVRLLLYAYRKSSRALATTGRCAGSALWNGRCLSVYGASEPALNEPALFLLVRDAFPLVSAGGLRGLFWSLRGLFRSFAGFFGALGGLFRSLRGLFRSRPTESVPMYARATGLAGIKAQRQPLRPAFESRLARRTRGRIKRSHRPGFRGHAGRLAMHGIRGVQCEGAKQRTETEAK